MGIIIFLNISLIFFLQLDSFFQEQKIFKFRISFGFSISWVSSSEPVNLLVYTFYLFSFLSSFFLQELFWYFPYLVLISLMGFFLFDFFLSPDISYVFSFLRSDSFFSFLNICIFLKALAVLKWYFFFYLIFWDPSYVYWYLSALCNIFMMCFFVSLLFVCFKKLLILFWSTAN